MLTGEVEGPECGIGIPAQEREYLPGHRLQRGPTGKAFATRLWEQFTPLVIICSEHPPEKHLPPAGRFATLLREQFLLPQNNPKFHYSKINTPFY